MELKEIHATGDCERLTDGVERDNTAFTKFIKGKNHE